MIDEMREKETGSFCFIDPARVQLHSNNIIDGTRMKRKAKVKSNAAYKCKKLTITVITGAPYILDLRYELTLSADKIVIE